MEMDHLFVKDVRKCTGVGKHYKTTSRKHIQEMFILGGEGYKISPTIFIQGLSSDRVSSCLQLHHEEEIRWEKVRGGGAFQ